MEASRKTGSAGRAAVIVCLLALFVTALALRYRGLDFQRFHPDEPVIEKWLPDVERHGYVTSRAYAPGFFTLYLPVKSVLGWFETQQQRWQCWLGRRAQLTPPQAGRTVEDIRRFNVWLAALTCLLVYGLGRVVTGRRSAGLLAAALQALAAIHVEHAHYAETDIAMAFMLTLSLLLLALHLRDRGLGSGLLTALATGFAIGTKFTLVSLGLLVLLSALLPPPAPLPPRARLRRAALRLPAFALAILLGWVWANPGVLEWQWFTAALQADAAATYGERARNLGRFFGLWWAPMIKGFLQGVQFSRQLGAGWLALLLPGLLLAVSPAYRRFAPVTLFFPALYFIQFVFLAPWVRSQEMLPFLPCFAVLAALPLAWLRAAPAPGHRLARIGVAALTALALLTAGRAAARMSVLFQWQDPRVAADDWLARHTPAGRNLCFEKYTARATYNFPGPTTSLIKMERHREDELRGDLRCDYILRNLLYVDRGMTDPRSLGLMDEFAAAQRVLLDRTDVVKQWSAQPGFLPTFVAHPVQLLAWRLPPAPRRLDLQLPRPAVLALPTARLTLGAPEEPVGSIHNLEVNRTPRTLAISRDPADRQPAYLVLETENRPATVSIQGFGRSLVVRLAPYDVQIIRLQRPWWRPPLQDAYELVTVRADIDAPNLLWLPCYLSVAGSPGEALRLAVDRGRGDRALAALGEDVARQPDLLLPGYLAAVQAGRPDLAARLRPRAEALLRDLASALTNAPAQVAVDGLPLDRYEAFARVRLPYPLSGRIDSPAGPPTPDDWRQARYDENAIPLPFRLPAGRYGLSLQMSVSTFATNGAAAGPLAIEDEAGRQLFSGRLADFTGPQPHPLLLELNPPAASQPSLKFVTATTGLVVRLSRLELQWTRASQLETAYAQLQEALLPPPPPATNGWSFVPFARLVQVRRQGDRLLAEVEFTAGQVPPLSLSLMKRLRGDTWREVTVHRIGDGLFHPRGQRVTVALDIPAGFDEARGGLSVKSAVRWYPGRLPLAGRNEPILPLQEAISGKP